MGCEIAERELAPRPALTYRMRVTMPTRAERIGAGFGVLMEHAAKTGAVGGRVATTTHVGPYPEVGKAYTALQKSMTDNGRRPAGPPREIYLNEPGVAPDAELLTEVDRPIA